MDKKSLLTPGQTLYEGLDDVHVVDRNANHTNPAQFLVFLIKDKGAPALVPAANCEWKAVKASYETIRVSKVVSRRHGELGQYVTGREIWVDEWFHRVTR